MLGAKWVYPNKHLDRSEGLHMNYGQKYSIMGRANGSQHTVRYGTLLPVEAMVVERDVGGATAADVLLHRPYDLAEPPVAT